MGAVGNVRERHLSEEPKPAVYVAGPRFYPDLSLVARTGGAVDDLVGAMRQAVWSVNPALSLSQEGTLPSLVCFRCHGTYGVKTKT